MTEVSSEHLQQSNDQIQEQDPISEKKIKIHYLIFKLKTNNSRDC